MSRKDYKAIAECFAYEMQDAVKEERDILKDLAMNLCVVFIRDNRTFNKTRFMQACGFNDEH